MVVIITAATSDHKTLLIQKEISPSIVASPSLLSDLTMADTADVWIYHERQQAQLCGQHALNNLVQSTAFSVGELAALAHELDRLEMEVWANNDEGGVNSKDYQQRLREGSTNIDEAGNFSIEVLKRALHQRYGLLLPHLSEQDIMERKRDQQDITEFQGFICHKSDHWFSIRKIGGRFWNLNSTLERPEVISHFQLAKEMEQCKQQGYTLFGLPQGLPSAGTKQGTGPHWHSMEQLLKGLSNSNHDPWQNVGSGMRLDGRNPTTNGHHGISVEGLTDEEQLQLALQASMEPAQAVDPETTVPVPPEPAQGASGAIRIQFKLPNGKRLVRRFLDTDSVNVVFSFVQEECGGKPVSLMCGFPPKDIEQNRSMTITEAKLANESIQGRFK